MTFRTYVLRRAGLALASVYTVVTLLFFMVEVTLKEDIGNVLARARWGGFDPEEVQEVNEGLTAAYNLEEPILERLVGWWVDVTTLDWGHSKLLQEPIRSVLERRVLTTLEYVLPGLLLALVLGILLGVVVALAREGALDWGLRLTAYLCFGIPVFLLATYLHTLAGTRIPLVAGWAPRLPALDAPTIGAISVALGLLAIQVRVSRAAVLAQTGKPFVKLLRAKGTNRLRLARHVLRNALLPIVSLTTTELLSVLVLNVFLVERVLDLPGLADLSLRAAGVVEWGGFAAPAVVTDPTLLLWSILVFVVLGITLSFLQDVCYGILDPRIHPEE